jgi:hypothetical protein
VEEAVSPWISRYHKRCGARRTRSVASPVPPPKGSSGIEKADMLLRVRRQFARVPPTQPAVALLHGAAIHGARRPAACPCAHQARPPASFDQGATKQWSQLVEVRARPGRQSALKALSFTSPVCLPGCLHVSPRLPPQLPGAHPTVGSLAVLSGPVGGEGTGHITDRAG